MNARGSHVTATSPHTHAYVGYRADGGAYFIFVDDASHDCAREVAKVIAGGGRIERMTIEDARRIRLVRRPR